MKTLRPVHSIYACRKLLSHGGAIQRHGEIIAWVESDASLRVSVPIIGRHLNYVSELPASDLREFCISSGLKSHYALAAFIINLSQASF